MPSGDSPDELLTTAEAARRLGVSPRRLRQLIDAGRIPARKVGDRLVVLAADVHAYRRKPVGRPKRE